MTNQSNINELAQSDDQYKVLSVSTGHLTESDIKQLIELSNDDQCNMVMGRDTGFFVKLYDEADSNQYPNMSDNFSDILITALSAGFRMIEFDSDARYYECFELFE